jgi:thymidylate kinase
MRFITVSGIDKSGKTSIIDAYMNRTKYVDYLVDRDPSNYMALNDIQDRIQSTDQVEEYNDFVGVFGYSVDLAILLTCEPQALEKRFKLNHEPDLVGNLSFAEHQAMIKYYFKKANYPNSLIIDTTDKTVDQCVILIINKLGE